MLDDESGFSYFRLRIPAALRAKIEAAAAVSGRSLNGQVLASIQAAIEQQDELEELRERNAEIERRLDRIEMRLDDYLGDRDSR